MIYEADTNGVIKANISVRNEQGKWVQKDAATSIFPSHWSKRQTEIEIESAFAKRRYIKNKNNVWRGVSPSGVVIEGVTYPDGRIKTAYPIHTSDLKVRTKPKKP